jgi:tetratricopeptide (TPR) repeat protein
VEDEEGNTVERVVPKPEFRKHAALYSFDNESGDATLDWLQHGIVMALEMDLSQDLFLAIETPGIGEPGDPLAEAGFPDGVGVPLALKRQLAADRNREYFIDGSFVWDGERYTIYSRLYETARGKELATRSVTGNDLFALIDSLSVQLRREMGVAEQHIEGTVDLPVSERLTASIPAFRLATRGLGAAGQNDIPTAQRFLAEAVEEDPTFALAQLMLGLVYFFTNEREEAERAWQTGLQHLYRLPESGSNGQLYWKALLYNLRGEETKALQTAEYAAELYPDDLWAHERLAEMYAASERWGEAIREWRAVYELDRSRTSTLLQVGEGHRRLGQNEQAEGSYKRYVELEPDDPAAHRELAFRYRLMGEPERARSSYERALVIDPEDTNSNDQLGRLAIDLGDFDAAWAVRNRALAAARSARDSAYVYGFDESFYYAKGQFAKLMEAYRLRVASVLLYTLPAVAALDVMQSEALLYAARWGEEAFALKRWTVSQRRLWRVSESRPPGSTCRSISIWRTQKTRPESWHACRRRMEHSGDPISRFMGRRGSTRSVEIASPRCRRIRRPCGAFL